MDSEEDILENSLFVVGVEVEELAGPEGVLERVLVRAEVEVHLDRGLGWDQWKKYKIRI